MSSFDKIAQLAEEFIVKIAEHQYEDQAPKDVKADELTWLDVETRQEVKANGTDEVYQPSDKPHNPPSVVANEKIWNRAKKAVKPYWKKYKEPWATVMHVYREMHGKFKKRKKK